MVGGKDPDSGGGLDSDDDDDDPDSLFVGRHPKSKRSGPGPGGPKFSPKFRQDLVRLTAGRKNSNSVRNSVTFLSFSYTE
jgi:hypothetical protein